MNSLTQITIPTTETTPKDLPDTSRSEIPLPSDINTVLLAGLFTLAALTAAYWAAEVIMPVVLAIVLKLLLQPGMRFLLRFYVPRSLAALLLIAAMIGIIFAVGYAVSGPARTWIDRIPEGLPRIEEKVHFISAPVQRMAKMLKMADTMGEAANAAPAFSLGLGSTLFAGAQHFASGLLETAIILYFLLASGDLFLRRIVEIMPRFKDKRQVVDISLQIEDNVSAYLFTISAMNLAVGVATTLIMWACGISDPIVWGLLAFLLNFVPILGPFVGIVVFLLVGLMEIDNFWLALAPAGGYFLVHLIEGETVTPMLLARRFTLNPVLVIVGLIFWFWMWGVPGAILSVPMLAIAKIICDGVKPLNAIGHFIEGESL